MKISIVTVCFNSENTIEETFKSILNQTEKRNLEYIVIDGKSNDNTINIIKKYENIFKKNKIDFKWLSEKDNGMYDALNKGFNLATGEVLGWINSDDMLLPWTIASLKKIMRNEQIKWVTGIPSTIDKNGNMFSLGIVNKIYYSRRFIKYGFYQGKGLGFIQQESTFWKKELWEKSGGEIPKQYKLAGDFWLWKTFANYENLYSVDILLASFRIHENQKTSVLENYYSEIKIGYFSKILYIFKNPIKLGMIIISLFSKKSLKMNNILKS